MQEKIKHIYNLCLTGKATSADREELARLLSLPENELWAKDFIRQQFEEINNITDMQPESANAVLEAIFSLNKNDNHISPVIPMRKKKWVSTVAAAAILLVLFGSVGYFFLFDKPAKDIVNIEKPGNLYPENDIAPGSDKAILTLADGSKIELDSAAKGAITTQGSVTVINLNGQLTYNNKDQSGKNVLFNTITTPRGGQYQLVLTDGTRVWLNAASSLRYPTTFVGNERKVEMTGEGYFEVAHNAQSPFKVSVNNVEIQVLGTTFNINAYMDEAGIKTTLLEGSVRVLSGDKKVIIAPGEQANINKNSDNIFISKNVDIEGVVAWKNGIFYFENMPFDEMMRHLSRWYNLEVEYENGVPDIEFGGKMGRDVHLSKILEFFRKVGVQCRLEENEKKLIISRK